VPFGDFLPVKVPEGPSDDRFLFLSDVLPTAWQALKYADVPDGGTLLVLGAGPIGDMAARMGVHAGHRVISVDRVPERLARVEAHGAGAVNLDEAEKLGGVGAFVRELTDGRGPDAVIDAVGMEAHGNPVAQGVQKFAGLLPDKISEPILKNAGIDRLAALHTAIDAVRRGGTISISGVYGGAMDPMPMFQMFDKQVQVRMGQANVRAYTDELLAILQEGDPWDVESFATHHLPLDEAPNAYEHFQKKEEGMVKVVFRP
jgi:threonine dehydrogenase-like Zn-dependent dehydrogenase